MSNRNSRNRRHMATAADRRAREGKAVIDELGGYPFRVGLILKLTDAALLYAQSHIASLFPDLPGCTLVLQIHTVPNALELLDERFPPEAAAMIRRDVALVGGEPRVYIAMLMPDAEARELARECGA